jgi:hypothetical protein
MVLWLVAPFTAGIVQNDPLLSNVFHGWNCPEWSSGLWRISRLDLSRVVFWRVTLFTAGIVQSGLLACDAFHGWNFPE